MSTRAKSISAVQVVNGVTNRFEILGWSNPKENNIAFNPATGQFSFGSAQNAPAIAASGSAAAAEWEAKAKADKVWADAIQNATLAGLQLGSQLVAAYYGRPAPEINLSAITNQPASITNNAEH
jgi:hypothetical protein